MRRDAVLIRRDVDDVHVPVDLWDRVSTLLVRQDDDAVVRAGLSHCGQRAAEVRAAVRLAEIQRIAQGETRTRGHLDEELREAEHPRVLAQLASEDRQRRCCVEAVEIALGADAAAEHRAGDVDEQAGVPRQLGLFAQAREHPALQMRLEVRDDSRGSDEAERQHTAPLALFTVVPDILHRHAGFDHVAQVAQEGQIAELVLGHQTREGFLLVLTGRQLDFPRIGRLQLVIDQLAVEQLAGGKTVGTRAHVGALRDRHLILDLLRQHTASAFVPFLRPRGEVRRLAVTQEQHVLQGDVLALAVVLGEAVLVELGERLGEAQLDLLGERAFAVFPVDCQELGQLVRALDHTRQRL